MSIHEDTANELGEGLATVKEGLARISSKVQMRFEAIAARPIFMECLRHLIVAGNALIHQPLEGGTPRMFRLDQYVVLRNEIGEILELIVKEMVYPSSLDPAILPAVGVNVEGGKELDKLVELYTHVRRIGDELVHYQEINGKLVPGSEGSSPYDSRGWIALRWQAIPGSDYGRAMVSEYAGDLLSLEDISKAIVQFAAVAARIVHVVDPNAMIDIDELTAAETGDFLTGYGEKIKTLQLEKAQDFQIANLVAERLEQRLSNAFMLRSGMTRNAERVTAEEIRAVAQELENVLGGTYTVLSAEFQLPWARRMLYILQKEGQAPELPSDVTPTVVTGFDAMGRTQSANKLKMLLADLSATLGPTAVQSMVNGSEVAMRLGESYGVEALNQLFKSTDQMAEDQQAEQANAVMAAAAPQIAKGAADAMNQQETPEV